MQSNTLDLVQGSQQWLNSRMGRFTCSEFHRLMADAWRPMTKQELDDRAPNDLKRTIIDRSLLAEGAITYVYEKVAEILTDMPAHEQISSKPTEWGDLYEDDARRYYERVFKVKVETVGNIVYDYRVSGSPDGLIGDAGGIEIKCPYLMSNHVRNLLLTSQEDFKALHNEYYWQIQGYLLITGRKWFDFVSYHPYFEGSKKIAVVRIKRHPVDIETLEMKLNAAKNRVADILAYIN